MKAKSVFRQPICHMVLRQQWGGNLQSCGGECRQGALRGCTALKQSKSECKLARGTFSGACWRAKCIHVQLHTVQGAEL